MTVAIGNAACELQSVAPGSLTCLNSPEDGTNDLVVTLNGNTYQTTVTYSTAITLSPSKAIFSPVFAEDLTLTDSGNSIPTTSTPVVIMTLDSDPTVQVNLYVSSHDNTNIVTKYRGAKVGTYTLTVQHAEGYTNSLTITVKNAITSITPNSGSEEGGTEITINGSGFAAVEQVFTVQIGNIGETVDCTVIDQDSTYVTCITGPKHANWATGPVVVLSRIVEESTCEGTCDFTYSSGLTPIVDTISGNTVAPGETLQVQGSNLDPTGSVTMTLNGIDCPILNYDANQITCTVPADMAPVQEAELLVTVEGKGYPRFDGVSNVVDVTLALDSISQSDGPSTGVLLILTGKGFTESTTVSVGGSECVVRQNPAVTSTSLQCFTKSFGTVTISDDVYENIGCSSACSISSAAGVATISSISKSGDVITIQGTGFSVAANAVNLILNSDPSYNVAGGINS